MSFLGYSGLAQPGEIGGFGQGADLGIVEPARFLDVSEARIGFAQPLCLGELRLRAFGMSFKRIGGGEIGVDKGQTRVLTARLFQRLDRLIDVRLEKLNDTHPPIPWGDPRSRWVQADGA